MSYRYQHVFKVENDFEGVEKQGDGDVFFSTDDTQKWLDDDSLTAYYESIAESVESTYTSKGAVGSVGRVSIVATYDNLTGERIK